MATIPTAANLGDRPIPRRSRAIVTDDSARITAEAVQGFANTVQQVSDKFFETREKSDLARAQSSLLQADVETRSQLANDPDTNKYAESMRKATETASMGISSTRARNAFMRAAQDDITRGSFAISQAARAKAKDAERGALQETLLRNMNSGLAAPDEAMRATILENTKSNISLAVETGSLSAEEAAKLRQTWTQEYAKRSVGMLDPAARVAVLSHPEGSIAAILPADQQQVLLREAQVQTRTQAILQTYQQSGTDAGSAEMGRLDNSALTPEQRDEVRSKVNSQLSQLRTQRREEYADDLVDIQTAISTDSAGVAEHSKINRLYQLGALTPAEYASFSANVEATIAKRTQGAAASKAIAQALRSGLPLDPSNSEHRKALSAAFTHDVSTLEIGTQPWQSTALAYANKARMLPDQASAWARQAMRSPEPKIAASAAQFLGAVEASAPDAASSFDQNTKAFAGLVNSMIEAGTDPQKAVETARNNVFEQKSELTKHREQQYSAGGANSFATRSDAALKEFIGKDFGGGWFKSDPAPVANLSADFNSQAQRYYVKTGDITLARQLAWQDLKRVYGPSNVNGSPVVMAFPPEKFGVSPEMVRKDIGDFLKGNPQADGSGATDVFLVPDGLTLRAVGDALTGETVRPSYKLVTKAGDLVVDRNGVPKRYTVPTGEALAERFVAAQKQATAESQAIVNQARADREVMRQRAELLRRGELR